MTTQPEIEVELINYTSQAAELLIYTKQTRLTLGKETRDKVYSMSPDEKMAELDYMANTIPSSWEFVDYVFEIKNVSRAFTHQFVRTRTGSYAQQTMRMLEMEHFTYRIPPELGKNQSPHLPEGHLEEEYCNTMKKIQSSYDYLIKAGARAEDARGVLPTNIHTNIIAKFNLRTMAELAKSRTGGRTQDEYVQVFNKMVDSVIEVHPWAEKFLFPVGRDTAQKLEEIIKKSTDAGVLTIEEAVEGKKAIDKLKKGEF